MKNKIFSKAEVRRSWLIVPANDIDAAKRAQSYLPDVIVLDLEYSVPPKYKEEARSALKDIIPIIADGPSEIFVRVDWKTRWCDVKAAINHGVSGLILSGPEHDDEISDIDKHISNCEREHGLVSGSLELVLILESAQGIRNAISLAQASPRVVALGLGRVDLTMRLGQDAQGEFRLYHYLMSRTLVVARALRKQPLGAHWRPGSRGGSASPKQSLEAAIRAHKNGFTGCLCVKSEQVAAINRGFTPSSKEIKKAENVLKTFQNFKESRQDLIEVDGHFYDSLKVSCVQNTILFARACAKRDEDKSLLVGRRTEHEVNR